MPTAQNLKDSKDFNDVSVKREEHEVRCGTCRRLLQKVSIVTSVSKKVRELMELGNIPLSKVIPGVEVKICFENKCRGCKKLDYKLAVI